MSDLSPVSANAEVPPLFEDKSERFVSLLESGTDTMTVYTVNEPSSEFCRCVMDGYGYKIRNLGKAVHKGFDAWCLLVTSPKMERLFDRARKLGIIAIGGLAIPSDEGEPADV